MSEFTVGDMIEAVKGENTIRGRVQVSNNGRRELGDTYRSIDHLRVEGWTLTLIEAATPPLPTEPGLYVDGQGDAWRLNASGNWYCHASTGDSDTPEHFAPFTRLEPVSVTAKKVLEAIDDTFTAGHTRVFSYDTARQIAKQFGVTK